ncbi:hypothetical protein H6P81_014616 [Aristolochia fimbriata]|uniref:tRNA(His) guanylyltransferase n=1 Tax=Aristolochia fimbriata TaxID=158543 RepID=A0AAV7E5Z8_ARIFI|nr:hypothetical protein H6P81_014616 [Aristolochia fimbriata]
MKMRKDHVRKAARYGKVRIEEGNVTGKTRAKEEVSITFNSQRGRSDPPSFSSLPRRIPGRTVDSVFTPLTVQFICDMAKSKYEYVQSFEDNDALPTPLWIVVRIDGHNFHRFANVHNFEKPVDERAPNLMNSCAVSLLSEFPDIVFAYGACDKYSFVIQKATHFYSRRVSILISIIPSIFSSTYTRKWKEFFPHEQLQYQPAFAAEVDSFVSALELKGYLSSRQEDSTDANLYDTCFWMLVKSGKNKTKAEKLLRGTSSHEKTELLYQQFRKGSIAFKIREEAVVKYIRDDETVKRSTKKCRVEKRSMANSPVVNDTPSTFHVIRVDGRHFSRFSDCHDFEKPNDERALDLMNARAITILKEIPEIVLAYGVSDECRKLTSFVASFFSSTYVIKWKEFFPHKQLQYSPSFDACVVCHPTALIVQHYFSWRQADCDDNNLYNTPFWMLCKSGRSKIDAQEHLMANIYHFLTA